MTKEVVKNTQEQIVNEYLNKRFRHKDLNEKDPMHMVVADMMNNVMRGMVRDVAKGNLGGVVFDYLIEA